MGLFLCRICNESNFEGPHVCLRENIETRIDQLENEARLAENNLEKIKDAVLLVLAKLPTLEGEQVLVQTKLIQQLWNAIGGRWYEAKNLEDFLSMWLVTHRILCEAYDLFRSKKGETLLDKLKILKEAVDNSKTVLGYENSVLDLSPEDLLKN